MAVIPITKSGDGACQIVLVLAGEIAAREVNKIAPDVMSHEFADRVESFRLAPTHEKAEFEAVKFAGGRGLAAGFVVQQKTGTKHLVSVQKEPP